MGYVQCCYLLVEISFLSPWDTPSGVDPTYKRYVSPFDENSFLVLLKPVDCRPLDRSKMWCSYFFFSLEWAPSKEGPIFKSWTTNDNYISFVGNTPSQNMRASTKVISESISHFIVTSPQEQILPYRVIHSLLENYVTRSVRGQVLTPFFKEGSLSVKFDPILVN